MKRVNIGCGQKPICNWYNYDNSYSVYIASHPILFWIIDKLKILDENKKNFIFIAKNNNIRWADSTKIIPLPDKSVEVIYTSHMLEHLDRTEVKAFLKESLRILIPNGIIRIAVPDIRKIVDRYLAHNDADIFLEETFLTRKRPKKLIDKLKYLIIGDRNHQWMYDGNSLIRLLSSMGFRNACVVSAGKTTISDPKGLNLYEHEDESLYIEAYAPDI